MRKLFLLCSLMACSLIARPLLAETPEEQIAAASALFSAQKYAEAAQKLDAFLAGSPKHPKAGVVAFTLGRCRSELKQYPQAISAYDKAIAFKDPTISQLAYLGLGEAATYAHQYDRAADALDVAVKGTLKPDQAPIAWYWLAEADLQLQRYDRAEAAFNKIIRDYSRSDYGDAGYYGAGVVALKLKKTDEARQNFKTLISRYPRSEDRPQATLLLAQLDLDAKRYQEARTEFESLLKDFASTPKGQKIQASAEDGLIQTLLVLQDYNAATGRLESALKRLPATDPQHFRAELSLGHCRYRQKEYDMAYPAYLEASKSPEPSVAGEGLYWAGNAALGQNKAADAAALFAKYVTKYPSQGLASKAQLKAADAYLSAKQNEQARVAYQAVVTNYPQSAEATDAKQALKELKGEKTRGTIQAARRDIQAQKLPEALTELTSLLKTNPEPDVAAEAQYLLGVVNEEQKKAAPAVAAYAESLRLKPDAAWAADIQSSLAWLYLELKQPANAEKAANAALAGQRTKEQEEQARLALLQALIEEQKWDVALDTGKTILDKNPSQETAAAVLLIQANSYHQLKKNDEEMTVWEKIANDFPKSSGAAEALLHLGDARAKEEKWEEARAKYAQLVMDFPQSPFATEARLDLGSALYHLEKYPESAAEYDAVANNKTAGDSIPEALYWAGVAYTKADKKDEAIKRLSTLVDKYPKHARVQNAKTRLAALKAVSN